LEAIDGGMRKFFSLDLCCYFFSLKLGSESRILIHVIHPLKISGVYLVLLIDRPSGRNMSVDCQMSSSKTSWLAVLLPTACFFCFTFFMRSFYFLHELDLLLNLDLLVSFVVEPHKVCEAPVFAFVLLSKWFVGVHLAFHHIHQG
jgi:hypothetical protein